MSASDITTPICPTCNGDQRIGCPGPGGDARTQKERDALGLRKGIDYCYGMHMGHDCPDCTDGHIPPKVWVGMLTDALRLSHEALNELVEEHDACWCGDGITEAKFTCVLCQADETATKVLALADSVTPKENE